MTTGEQPNEQAEQVPSEGRRSARVEPCLAEYLLRLVDGNDPMTLQEIANIGIRGTVPDGSGGVELRAIGVCGRCNTNARIPLHNDGRIRAVWPADKQLGFTILHGEPLSETCIASAGRELIARFTSGDLRQEDEP